jgi:small subunit ribosomal protein S20
MANNKSAEKRIRVNERRRLRNQTYRSATRTIVRKAERAIESGVGEETLASLQAAMSRLDSTAGKGIIHRNAAARKKSRLMIRYNKLAGIGKAAQVAAD